MSMPVLGIVAAGGRLPSMLVEACRAQAREYFVLALEGFTDRLLPPGTPHTRVRLGAAGTALAALHQANVKDLVLAGHMRRPKVSEIFPDKVGAQWMLKLSKYFLRGDDALLSKVIALLEEEGFRVVGVDEVIDSLRMPQGVLTHKKPTPEQETDIALGMTEAKKLGLQDLGQGVIVAQGKILGRETSEGTAALIRTSPPGILVKACKPQQEKRVDLPTIGPDTIHQIHEADGAGVAVEAGRALLIDREGTIALANELGLFIVGV